MCSLVDSLIANSLTDHSLRLIWLGHDLDVDLYIEIYVSDQYT
jgi:hypothetical protein